MREPVENGPANEHAWLVRVKGLGGPARYRLRGTVTRVGRHPENDIVIETSTTSSHHSEISWEVSKTTIFLSSPPSMTVNSWRSRSPIGAPLGPLTVAST